jgi:hypothetical protein
MAPDDVKKTTIITKLGLYEWNIMPFNLKNAINTFSQIVADIFKEWTNQILKVFLDDVNIHSRTWSEHLCHIQLVFKKMTEVNFKLNLGKSYFGSKNITFLGHIVDCTRSQLDPRKVAVIMNFPTLKITTNVRAFMGLTRYYKRFIVRYAKINVYPNQ